MQMTENRNPTSIKRILIQNGIVKMFNIENSKSFKNKLVVKKFIK